MIPPRIIEPLELQTWFADGKAVTLIDVLPEEYFLQRHIHAADNVCVYEVNFLDQVASLVDGLDSLIVVYGPGTESLASSTAASKLVKAGYRNVYDLHTGLHGWRDAGGEVDRGAGEAPAHETQLLRIAGEQQVALDLERTRVTWFGRNLASQHEGGVAVDRGWVNIKDGFLRSGEVVLDMRRISCRDIGDSGLNRLLVAHLESDDFFDVEAYPEARLAIARAQRIDEAPPGQANYVIDGELTLRGITGELRFPAMVGNDEGGGLVAQTHFDIDRTRWGVNYGSGRLFQKLGKHLVNDLISLQVAVFTEPQ